MSSPEIVRDIRSLTQKQLLTTVPTRWRTLFRFGLKAYGLTPFQSANGNARTVTPNPATAATMSDRLLANVALASTMGVLFDTLQLVTPSSFVNVDHSDMHGLVASGCRQ